MSAPTVAFDPDDFDWQAAAAELVDAALVQDCAVDTLANRLLDRGTVDADAVEVLRAVRRAHERLAAGVATP